MNFSPSLCSTPLHSAKGHETYSFGISPHGTADELRRFATLVDGGTILISAVRQEDAATDNDFLTHTITITYCTKTPTIAP